MDPMKELFLRIRDRRGGVHHELVTVLRGAHAGEKALLENGSAVWTSGGLTMEALRALPREDIFREEIGDVRTAVVCGAGHVGRAVIRLGKFLGWHVVCLDDREAFCAQALRDGADESVCGRFGALLADNAKGAFSYDAHTCFVVVTRGHTSDLECLEEIFAHPFGYLGMMGSRSRTQRVRSLLKEHGIPEEKTARLHAPIGLKIGAVTPEEIAVSIVSQILQETSEGKGKGCAFPKELLDALLALYGVSGCPSEDDRGTAPDDADGKAGDAERPRGVLATILSVRGSAPRGSGTRMLIRADLSTVGTVGGGCMEAEVIRSAGRLMAGPCPAKPEVITVDLTGRAGLEADMLCGGVTDVLLEML